MSNKTALSINIDCCQNAYIKLVHELPLSIADRMVFVSSFSSHASFLPMLSMEKEIDSRRRKKNPPFSPSMLLLDGHLWKLANRSCGFVKLNLFIWRNGFGPRRTTLYTQCMHVQLAPSWPKEITYTNIHISF